MQRIAGNKGVNIVGTELMRPGLRGLFKTDTTGATSQAEKKYETKRESDIFHGMGGLYLWIRIEVPSYKQSRRVTQKKRNGARISDARRMGVLASRARSVPGTVQESRKLFRGVHRFLAGEVFADIGGGLAIDSRHVLNKGHVPGKKVLAWAIIC